MSNFQLPAINFWVRFSRPVIHVVVVVVVQKVHYHNEGKTWEKRPRGIHFGGSALLCYFFARFSHIFLLSLPFADATTRCEIVFLMNQMWSADFPLLCSFYHTHTHHVNMILHVCVRSSFSSFPPLCLLQIYYLTMTRAKDWADLKGDPSAA